MRSRRSCEAHRQFYPRIRCYARTRKSGHNPPFALCKSRLVARGAVSLRSSGVRVAFILSTPARADTSLQLRIAWGDGAVRQWSGEVALSEGQLTLHRPLGIEADEPGSIWVEGNRLAIRQRSPRQYDGVDVFVDAPLDARLLVSMSADPRNPPFRQEIRLAELVQKPFTRALDEHGNRLLVRRAPGDMLRVRLPGDSLVFSPGERLTIDLKPHLLPVADGANVRIRSRLVAKGSGEEHWSSRTMSPSRPATALRRLIVSLI